MTDLQDILHRAKGLMPGSVSPEEVEYARKVLRTEATGVEQAMDIVAICGGDNNIEADVALVERYLSADLADRYGERALDTLCRHFDLIDRYYELVKNLILSDQDVWSNSRTTSIHLAYLYIRKKFDADILRRLYEIFLDEADVDQASARFALISILNLRSSISRILVRKIDLGDQDSKLIKSEFARYLESKSQPGPSSH